jgi:hypothetical protein
LARAHRRKIESGEYASISELAKLERKSNRFGSSEALLKALSASREIRQLHVAKGKIAVTLKRAKLSSSFAEFSAHRQLGFF